jgi:hypothetical protein
MRALIEPGPKVPSNQVKCEGSAYARRSTESHSEPGESRHPNKGLPSLLLPNRRIRSSPALMGGLVRSYFILEVVAP